MKTPKDIVNKIPRARSLYIRLCRWVDQRNLKGRPIEDVFTEIHSLNKWGSLESRSGPGSTKEQTAEVVKSLPLLFKKRGVRSLLDIPCGDFNWFKDVEMDRVRYIGGDIVASLVDKNSSAFSREGIEFRKLDLLSDPLPRVDLILCRDCMVHLSHSDVKKALSNICRSEAKFLLATSFLRVEQNIEIVTGEWRPLNLERHPFDLPAPLEIIAENCTENGGRNSDKTLCLWSIDDLRKHKESMSHS